MASLILLLRWHNLSCGMSKRQFLQWDWARTLVAVSCSQSCYLLQMKQTLEIEFDIKGASWKKTFIFDFYFFFFFTCQTKHDLGKIVPLMTTATKRSQSCCMVQCFESCLNKVAKVKGTAMNIIWRMLPSCYSSVLVCCAMTKLLR